MGRTMAGLEQGVLALRTAPSGEIKLAQLEQEQLEDRRALQEVAARYQSLFEGMPIGLYRTALDGQILDANPALVRMLGCPDREALLAMNAADLYLEPEERGRELATAEREGIVRGFEMQLRRCDGNTIWVRDTCRAVEDAAGKVAGFEGSLEDITEQKRSEAEVQRLLQAELERRQLAEMLVQSSVVLSSTLELDEVLELILQQLRRVLPYDSASVQRLRKDRLEIVACQGFKTPDEVVGVVFPLQPVFPNYDVVVQRQAVTFEDVTRHYRHFKCEAERYCSGRIRSWLGVPLLAKDQSIGMIAIDRAGVCPFDPEEIELATAFASQAAIAIQNASMFEELERRRVYLEAVLRSAPDAIVTLDAGHRIVEWNPGAQRLFGYSVEEVLGQDIDDLITNSDTDEGAQSITRTVLGGGEVHLLEATRSRKDGSTVEVIVSGSPMIVGDELLGVFAGYTDITELKRAQDDLRQSLEQTARSRRLLLTLSEAAQAVQRARTPAEVYRTTSEEIGKLGLRASVLAATDGGKSLTVEYTTMDSTLRKAARSVAGLPQRGSSLCLKEGGLCHGVVAGRSALYVPDAVGLLEELLPSIAGQLAGRVAGLLGLHRAILAPLTSGSEVHGILVVSGDALSDDDVPAVSAFASQAAIALENARLLETVTEHGRRLQKLSLEIVNVQEEERKRLAQELHDEMGQSLTAIRINLAALERDVLPGASADVRSRVTEAASLVEQMLDQTRDLALDLRPAMLDDLGLLPTLEWYVGKCARRLGIDIDLRVAHLDGRLTPEKELVVFRAVQEACTNVSKHAQARRMSIRLECADDVVSVLIVDDGRGFEARSLGDSDVASRGAGLFGMSERLANLGGSLEVSSAPGEGTELFIQLPV